MQAQMMRRRMSTGLSAAFFSALGGAGGFAATAEAPAAGVLLSVGWPWFSVVMDAACYPTARTRDLRAGRILAEKAKKRFAQVQEKIYRPCRGLSSEGGAERRTSASTAGRAKVRTSLAVATRSVAEDRHFVPRGRQESLTYGSGGERGRAFPVRTIRGGLGPGEAPEVLGFEEFDADGEGAGFARFAPGQAGAHASAGVEALEEEPIIGTDEVFALEHGAELADQRGALHFLPGMARGFAQQADGPGIGETRAAAKAAAQVH